MSLGVIAAIKPGHVMSDEYRKLFLAEAVSFSYAVAKNNVLEFKMVNSNEFDLEKSLKNVEELTKDRLLLVRAEREALTEDEEQPFEILLDKDGNVLLTAFVEGDFAKYATDTAKSCPEAEFIEGYFADTVSKLYADCGGDLKKTTTVMESAAFREKMLPHMEPRGVIITLTHENHESIFSRNNAQYAEFPWGGVSKSFGYTEKKVETPAAGSPIDLASMSYKERKLYLAKQKEGNAPITTSVPTVPGTGPQPGTEDDDTDVVIDPKEGIITTPPGSTEPHFFPPKKLEGRGLRKFYTTHRIGGHKSGPDWRQRPGIPASKISKHSPVYSQLNPTPSKALDTAHIQAQSSAVVAGPIPIMSPDTVKEVTEHLQRLSSMNETDLKDVEEKFALFSKRLNTEFAKLVVCKYEWIAGLSIEALRNYAQELRLYILKEHPEFLGAAKPAEEVDISKMSYKERKAYLARQEQGKAA